VPGATPVTTPVAATTVATGRFPLVHVPPEVESLNEIVPPTHTDVDGAIIGVGVGLTENVRTVVQPPIPYIIETFPPDTVLTTPVLIFTVAMAELLLVHIPPGVASESKIEVPEQVAPGPVMAAGAVTTVIVYV